MTYHKIKFFHNPLFTEMDEIKKMYYVVRDVAAEGGYSIILELTSNGRVNNTLFGY
jgi:hypothetical protein